MQEQPVISHSLAGPAAWPHSKFRLTAEKLKASGFKLMLPPEETVARFATYCDYVERHGQWHTETAMQEGILNAKHVHQSVKNHRRLLPLHYWRTTWPSVDVTPREDKSGTKTFEALKGDVAVLNKRVVIAESTLSEAVANGVSRAKAAVDRLQLLATASDRHEACISTLDHDVGILIKAIGKSKRGPSRLTRFHRELRRRLRVLVSGGK